MRLLKISCCLTLSVFIMMACSKKELIEPESVDIKFVKPANFPEPIYKFQDNTLTTKGFLLGKKLFYDARLSADKSVSCGSCHQQFAAFAQLDHAVSHGVNNCLGKRNAPVLFNLAWQKEFFWDGGAKNLEIVPINAITDACEMGTDLSTVTAFLNETPIYRQLFQDAFGTSTINSQLFLKALTQFMAPMVSANSKYDQVMRNKDKFSSEENEGFTLFKQKCATCHAEPLFTDLSYRDNGLLTSDDGRKVITGLASDQGKFRVPTLRNIALSAPYMHDGRFNTLQKVLDHYHNGVTNNANLDPILKTSQLGISLNATQKQQIISFLNTLTDHEFIKNKNFSEN